MHYKGTAKTAPEIGRELGVDTLIEGTVQRAGNRVRIRIQVIDSASDRHLWAEEVTITNSKMYWSCERVSSARYCGGSPGEKSLPCRQTSRPVNANRVDPGAYEAYLKGRYFWNKRTEDRFEKEHRLFPASHFTRPKVRGCVPAGMADTYSILGSDVLPAQGGKVESACCRE